MVATLVGNQRRFFWSRHSSSWFKLPRRSLRLSRTLKIHPRYRPQQPERAALDVNLVIGYSQSYLFDKTAYSSWWCKRRTAKTGVITEQPKVKRGWIRTVSLHTLLTTCEDAIHQSTVTSSNIYRHLHMTSNMCVHSTIWHNGIAFLY